MKKILFIFTLMCAFTFSANAQEKKTAESTKINAQVEAKKDASDLASLLKLNDTQTNDFYRLFEMKYQILQENLSADRKNILAQDIEAKIRATLNADQMKTLEAKKELFSKLVRQ